MTFYEKQLQRTKELIKIQKHFSKMEKKFPFHCESDKIVIYIDNLSQLSDARSLIKTIHPDWKDKIKQIWCSGPNTLVSWEDNNHRLLEIRLKTPRNEFPRKLLPNDSCHFQSKKVTEYDLVCKNANL